VVKFGARPSSASNARSMAKPNSANEPGPGQYIDPMKESRTETGEVIYLFLSFSSILFI